MAQVLEEAVAQVLEEAVAQVLEEAVAQVLEEFVAQVLDLDSGAPGLQGIAPISQGGRV